jgi:NADH:ubiquinone oxidoreductase subunit K
MFTNCFIAIKTEGVSDILGLLDYSFIIFILGLIGTFYHRQDLLIVLLCFEVLALAVSINMIIASIMTGKIVLVFILMIITLAAIESAIGLALYVILYRVAYSVNFAVCSHLKF